MKQIEQFYMYGNNFMNMSKHLIGTINKISKKVESKFENSGYHTN